MKASGSTPIAVHVALPHPLLPEPAHSSRGPRQPETFADSRIDWDKHGLEPRWLGEESSDCAAALDPSIFSNRGADERRRFLAGARERGEIALVIATLGHADDESPRSPLASHDASINMTPAFETRVEGRRSPTGTKPKLATEVTGPERDLGLRLLTRPPDAPWWAMELTGTTMYPGAGGPAITHQPSGTLVPIVVDGLGVPVVGVWISPDADQRVYVIPDQSDGSAVLDWLVTQALPEYVPEALRRARSAHSVDPAWQSGAEIAASRALTELETTYAVERARLEGELKAASAEAEPIRYALLYGRSRDLEDAVEAVLRAAGFTVVNLDDELAGTESADLLATYGSQRRLVEVKSASGKAPEKLVGALERHLTTWPALWPNDPVGGGVLVVNHQHREDPGERSVRVYERAAFVDSLTVEVLGSRELFTWWAAGDWLAIRRAVLGMAATAPAPASARAASAPQQPADGTAVRKSRWPWKRDR